MLKAAGGAALAVARAKALAQDAVKSDGAGSVNQALVGYKLTLKELEAGISLGEKEGTLVVLKIQIVPRALDDN